jgi:YD repeat-containing protein
MPEGRPSDSSRDGQVPTGGRLTVRRDAHRQLEYRYDREERLARRTAPRRMPTGASFLKSRTSRIFLLNAVLLVVIAFAAARLLLASGDQARIGPFEARLQAMPADGLVYVTLTLRLVGRAGAQGGAERFSVHLALEPGGAAVRKEAPLPRSPGEEVSVGEALPLAGAARVRADLVLGDRKRSLTRELGR